MFSVMSVLQLTADSKNPSFVQTYVLSALSRLIALLRQLPVDQGFASLSKQKFWVYRACLS